MISRKTFCVSGFVRHQFQPPGSNSGSYSEFRSSTQCFIESVREDEPWPKTLRIGMSVMPRSLPSAARRRTSAFVMVEPGHGHHGFFSLMYVPHGSTIA